MRENAFASEVPKGQSATFHAKKTRRVSPAGVNATKILYFLEFRK
jgi:hypothetical protein